MIDFTSFLNTTYWGNTGQQYITALGIFFFVMLILYIFKSYVLYALKKVAKTTKTDMDDYAVEFMQEVSLPFYFVISVAIAAKFLVLTPVYNKIIFYLAIIFVIYYLGKGLQNIVTYVTKKHLRAESRDPSLLLVLGKFIRVIIWIVAILFILSNLGINITSLIAGLGIGGIAIAFALQNILGDLFAAFTIYFDKPFKVGDFIIIGTDMGVIKHIGLVSTRIQALQGQEIVVSNRELTTTRINNYKRMKKRRIDFKFGVEYGTSVAQLKKVNEIVARVIAKAKLATLDRVHFKSFGDYSLNFEVVYYLDSKEYNDYMDTQQELNFDIKSAFEKEGIAMAFPTQTLYLKK
jgi:small-conductance mechanosensitive channel